MRPLAYRVYRPTTSSFAFCSVSEFVPTIIDGNKPISIVATREAHCHDWYARTRGLEAHRRPLGSTRSIELARA
jgi:hypothetical protein